MTMLAEYGTLSLGDVLAPAIQMADGYPIEAETADGIEREKAEIKKWKYSRAVFLPHAGEEREAPLAGEVFVQRDLAATLRKRGDSQDQNLLQWFLDIVEFGMTPQQAAEAPNFNSDQMRSSFGDHESRPGRLLANSSMPDSVRVALTSMGSMLIFRDRTSGPISGILFDRTHGTMWGASSNHGEDYGIAW